MKQNRLKTILLSLIAVVVLIGAIVVLKQQFSPKADGQIQVQLVELDGSVKSEKKIPFNNGQTLVELLEKNYDNVVVENGFLMSIDSFTTAADWSTFISIYVDNEMSMVGILEIPFKDGTVIKFQMTEYIPQ